MKFRAMNNERDVKENVRRVLNTTSAWWFMPMGTNLGRAGIPDFVGVVVGKGFGIETKFGKNSTSTHQDRELSAITAAGGKAWVVNEKNVESWAVEFAEWVALCS